VVDGPPAGHVVYRMIGLEWDRRSHDLRDALTVNGVPFAFHTKDSDSGRQLIRNHRVDVTRLPALIRHDGTVLQQPSMAEMAVSHGVQIRPTAPVYDLVVLGAGPAGLAAAVYGASEGLDTLVVEARSIGGQAGTSSMIRNYLGFHRGIHGGELAHRAWQQATLLGAEFIFTNRAIALTAETTCNTSTRDRARKRRPGEGRIVCIELLRCSKDWPHLPRRLPPESVDDYCALWLRLSFSVLGKGHLASGDHNQTGHRQRSTRDEHTQPEKAERDRRLHR
jgi:hypothetical protein